VSQPPAVPRPSTYYCTRCSEKLDPERVVWLELNVNTTLYSEEGMVPEGESQGAFPFGAACAKTVLRRGGECRSV